MRSLTKKHKLCLLIGINIGILAAAIVYVALFRYASSNGYLWFDCIVRRTLGIYCPACGGSRSVQALLSFDLWGAFVYFPPLLLCVVLLLSWDVRLLLDLLTNSTRFTERYHPQVWLSVPIAMLALFLLRLLLWLAWGIDPPGDLT